MRCVWLVVLVACSSKSKEPPKAEPPPVVADAAPAGPTTPKLTKCAEFAAAMCTAFERCMPHATFVKWNERKNCEAEALEECESWAVPNGKATDETIAVCLSDLPVIKCAHFRGWETTACKPPPGALADGEPCTGSAQCASGVCRKDYKANCDKCMKDDRPAPTDHAPGRAVGEACAKDEDCDDDLACVKARCTKAKLADIDQPCTKSFFGPGGSDPCKYGLECVEEGKKSVARRSRRSVKPARRVARGVSRFVSIASTGLARSRGLPSASRLGAWSFRRDRARSRS